MDCTIEDCEREAVGMLTVDNGVSKERKPACGEHEGERYETPGANERYRDHKARQRQTDHYGSSQPVHDPRL